MKRTLSTLLFFLLLPLASHSQALSPAQKKALEANEDYCESAIRTATEFARMEGLQTAQGNPEDASRLSQEREHYTNLAKSACVNYGEQKARLSR